MTQQDPHKIVVIRPEATTITKQQLPNFIGVSETTAGAKGISMNIVIIPAGGRAVPHLHRGYETAIYQLEGQTETRYGPNLEHSIITKAGDFLFIPANLPHQPINLSQTERVVAIVARNDPNEQESVEHHPK